MTPGPTASDPSGGITSHSLPDRLKGSLRWMRDHKVKALLIIAGAYLLFELLTIPYFSIARLRSENPGQTALMRQRLHEAEHKGKGLKITRRWVPLSRVSRNLIDAVVVAEDGAFYSHGGVDWFEVKESIEKDFDEGRVARGASTITQQLAKNLYLSTSKDPVRKLKELLITVLLENELSKSRILEIYLNVIEWGKGVFGAEAAARTYFGKSADALSLDEAARLAAVIPSPLRHRPNEDSRYVLRRKEIVLHRMEGRKMIEQPEPDESQEDVPALQQPPALRPDTLPVDSTDSDEEETNGF